MKEITNHIKWSAITLLLFLSGFALGSQFIENGRNVLAIDWSLPIMCLLASWIIHEVTELFHASDEHPGKMRNHRNSMFQKKSNQVV